MSIDSSKNVVTTTPLEERVLVKDFSPQTCEELAELVQSKQVFDYILIDARKAGFLFAFETLAEIAAQARHLLANRGMLALVKRDKVVIFSNDSNFGAIGFQLFDSHSDVYDYSPELAKHIFAKFIGEDDKLGQTNDLADQILMSTIPVLTSFGIKLKGGIETSRKRNILLAVIDNYTPLNLIAQRLVKDAKRMNTEELMHELRSLEESKAIFPVFAKVPFLVHCFKNKIAFQLSEYLLNARIISQDQLDDMVFQQQNTSDKVRLNLGAYAVSKGYLSCRQLEIAMQDQAFYGQGGTSEEAKMVASSPEEASLQSLVGYLGTTDPAGLLQSLATNRESGVLSVEFKGQQFRALFEQGRITHAKLAKIRGNEAIMEFVSVWREGIFVFIQRQAPPDLAHESSKLSKPLDKLLLDSALAQDNIAVVWNKLPKGANTPLERLSDVNRLFESGQMIDPQMQTPLTADEVQVMKTVWQFSDGLTPVSSAIENLEGATTLASSQAIDRLLHYNLVQVPREGIAGPLDKFQQIVSQVLEAVGPERNAVLLRLSLQATQGYSVRARMFAIGSGGEIGIDLAAARAVGESLSHILKDLDDWQVKYIEYASQEVDKEKLKQIVLKVHQ